MTETLPPSSAYRVDSEVGRAAQGAGLRSGAGARAADPDELRRPAVRRRPLGGEGEQRPRRLHGLDARPRGRGRRAARGAGRDAGATGRAGLAARSPDHGQPGRHRAGHRHPRLPRRPGPAGAGPVSDRRDVHPRSAGRPAAGLPGPGPGVGWGDRVPAAAAAQHPLHPRHHLLDLRRRDPQPAVLAGPAERDPADEGDLRVPPRLRRLEDLVGRPGGRLGAGHAWRAATSSSPATAWC